VHQHLVDLFPVKADSFESGAVLHANYLALFVTEQGVFEAARTYARQLLLSSQSPYLNKPAKPAPAPAKPTRRTLTAADPKTQGPKDNAKVWPIRASIVKSEALGSTPGTANPASCKDGYLTGVESSAGMVRRDYRICTDRYSGSCRPAGRLAAGRTTSRPSRGGSRYRRSREPKVGLSHALSVVHEYREPNADLERTLHVSNALVDSKV
jgi:hypothetical protein